MQKKLSPNFLSVNVTGVLLTRPGRVLLPLLVAVVALVVVLLLMGNSLTAYAADGIHYVAPTGADSAACTLLHPCLTIQQAITNAVSGDEIRVAAGTYTTINNLGSASQVVYLNKSLTLRGGFTLTNWLESDPLHNPTIIDAQSAGRGIYIPDPVTVVIEGFHVRKGYVSDGMGAGVDNEKGYLTLRNCEIYENEMSSINSADVGGGIGSGYGTNDAMLILENSRIYSNTANSAGGAAIGVVTGTAVINANKIFGNNANYGAISVLNEAVVTLQNNWIYANSASVGGGAVFIMGSGDLSIINNTLYKNDAASYGGALYAMGGTTALTNTLLVSNTAVSGGAIYTTGGTLAVAYCDFFGNAPDDYTPPTGQNNRTTQNPDFVDPGTYNLHLSSGSPAIDNATSLSTVTSDVDGNGRPFGAGFDRGADEYTAAAPCYARLNAGQVYTSVQMAVNASISDTDVVKIAGYCAGAQPHGTVTQTVYLSRSLTLRGGYTVTDWLTPRYGPTVLDAQNQGRVLYAGGASELSLTIENLHLTGGNAPSGGSGGGIYFDSNVDATVRNNVIYRNQADYRGGGIYNDGVAVLRHNTIYSNTASADGWASAGGGVYNNGNLTLQNNILFSNRAKAYGGGIYKRNASVVTGDYNDFYANTPDDYGNVAAGAHDLALPPHLADAEGGDFHLADASRLVNAADPASTLTRDFEYDVRPWVSRSDIGADESRFYTAVDLGAGLPVATRLITTAEFEAMKGQPVTFTHKFTNTGYTSALTDTFDVTATNLGGWDWTPVGDFSAITLDFSEQHTFTVVVTIPTTVTQGFYNQTLITVTSQTNPATFDTTVDAIANPGMVLTPTYQENADPGEVLTYTHTLTNTGPSDVFTITVSSSLAWGEKLAPTEPVTLAHGESTGIVVQVEVPSKAPANLADIMEVRATSQNFGISTVVTDTTTANATAGDRYVVTDGSDNNNNCTQMGFPCKTILHAVQQTAWGDTVFVASGEYAIEGELVIDQGINLRGDCTFDVDKNEVIFPDEIDPSATVMDFGGTSRGIHISAAAGAHPWIDGFTIKGASTAGVGGSVYIKSSAPTLSHLLLLDSQASKGGGVYIEAGQPILQDIVISNTVATGGGGALYNESGNATVQRVEIRNSAAQGGHGGGIYNEGGVLSVWNTFIYSNTATWGGGGLYNQGTLRLINDTFYGNQAATYGGGLFENGGSLVISNTIVVSNTATTGGGVYRAGAGALSADYNDIWSNTADSIPQSNLPGGTHDMAADPLFVDTATGDLHLIFDSPCLDTGDPHTFLTDDIDGELRPSNQGFDIGADEIAGCLARVVNPSSGEPVSPIFGSVQEAVDFAPVDYLVQVSGICRGAQPRWVGGQWISQTLLITKSLTVEGGYLPTFDEEERDPNPTILDAQGLGRVLVVTAPTTQVVSVKVTTMTLRGGDANAMTNGGGVYLDKGTLQLEHLIISENHATHGGGLYNHSGQLTLGEVAVLSNTASLRGGGLYNVGNTFTISHTRFFSNTAASTGGGIYNYNTGSLDVRSSIVLSNTAASGGGIYNTNALTLVNTLVAGNAVTSNGGGLYNDDLALVVRHVTFYANHAANRGGGIYHNAGGAQPLINSTLLVSNTANAAVDAGGGIYSANADPAFDYNNVYGNTPSNYGGSLLPGDGQGNIAADPEFVSFDPTSLDFLHIPEGSPVEDEGDPASPILVDIDEAPRPSNQNFDIGADEVGDCYIRINGELPTYGSPQLAVDHSQNGDILYVAGTCRGVRAAQHGVQTLYQSLFLTKSIGIQGGYSPQDWTEPQPSVYTTTIDALAAGRVVYLTDSAVVTMAGLQLRGGYAAAGGGALFIDSGVFTMTNCAVYSSTAAHGGAFYNYAGTAYLDGNAFYGNTATDGGAIYAAGGTTWLQNDVLHANQAEHGGAVYSAAGVDALTIRHDTFYANAATAEGGGLYTEDHTPVVRSTIFATNTATLGHAIYSAMSNYAGVDYNDVYPWAGGYANTTGGSHDLDYEPGFVDTEGGNFHLSDTSPLLDQGDPAMTLLHDIEGDLRPADQGFDIGADERRGCWARIVRGTGPTQEIYGPYGNPQLAIGLSQPGDEIQVTVGECRSVHNYQGLLQTVHITHNLTLVGGFSRDFTKSYGAPVYPDPDEHATTFNAQTLGRALLITNTTAITVERLNLLNGSAAWGGGLYHDAGEVQLDSVNFYSNTATARGGALYVAGGTVQVNSGRAGFNTAPDGGAFYQRTGVLTVMASAQLSENTATHGGALYKYGGTCYLAGDDAALFENEAQQGGAIYNSSSGQLLVTAGNVYSNTASSNGGALYNVGTATLDFGTRLFNNRAAQYGGAIYSTGSNLTVQNTLLISNTATQGGAVYLNSGTPHVWYNTLYQNTATTSGGGIYVAAGTPFIRNDIFDSNQAPSGSAIYGAAGDLNYNDYWPESAASQVAGGVTPGASALNEWPFYVNTDPEELDLHLESYSPLIDAGEEYVQVDHDMDGDPRPINAAADIGADEYTACLAKVVSTGKIYGRITTALNAANPDGDFIHLAEGTCYETLTLDNDITLDGGWRTDFSGMSDPRPQTTIDALDQDRVITIGSDAHVDIRWVSLRNGNTTEDGGGLYNSSSHNTFIFNISVHNNQAGGDGGGIYNSANSNMTIIDTSVYNNQAGGDGGGIYTADNSIIGVSGGGNSDNQSGGKGGGMYTAAGTLFYLKNYPFSYNTAATDGGGLYNLVGGIDLINVKYAHNTAQRGAGLYNTGSNVNLLFNTVIENEATNGSGGGIYNTGNGLNIDAGLIAFNTASTTNGNGIENTAGAMTINRTLKWQNDYHGNQTSGTGNIEKDPLLDWWWDDISYRSPAIDAVPSTILPAIDYDARMNDRPHICDKDMGYHEYAVGKRAFKWDEGMVTEATVQPGEAYTYTFPITNTSEHWLYDWDKESSLGPGTGYTETMNISLNSSQGWAAITYIAGASGVVTSSNFTTATFDIGPGQVVDILVRVTIPPTQTASVEEDDSTKELTSLDYDAYQCPAADHLTGASPEVKTSVARDYTFAIAPDNYGVALPGTTLTYTHVLTNMGNLTGTFDIHPKAGFYGVGQIMAPVNPLTLAPWMTETVVISVTINPEAAGGLTDITYAVARLEADGSVHAAANNTWISPTTGTRYVATDGQDSLVDETASGTNPEAIDYADNNCTQPDIAPCRTLQHAISQAAAGDTIKIATGSYTETYTTTVASDVITQVAFINKPITVTGGYLTSDWDTEPPAHTLHPTLLDAQGAGRVLYIESGYTVILERLELLNGDATGLKGGPSAADAGGDLYNAGSDLTLNALRIRDGYAELGGGLYSEDGVLSLTNNLIHNNGSGISATVSGGGGYVHAGDIILLNNTFADNTSSQNGGAFYIASGTLAVTNTIFASNDGGSGETGGDHAALHAEAAATVAADYNLYHGNTLTDVHPSSIYGPHDLLVDPSFGSDFHLQASSLARDAGDPATTLATDYENNTRPSGPRVDIGAYEYVIQPGVALEPNHQQLLSPGESHTYTHTLDNTGEYTDTFDITFASEYGWATLLTPVTVTLAPEDAPATVSVKVTVPLTDTGGLVDVTVITATSQTDPDIWDTATDTTQVRFTPGVDLSPGQSGHTTPATPITYTHTLTNTGDGVDTFTVTHQSPPGWTVVHSNTLTAPAAQTATLTVRITPPADAISGTIEPVTVTVTSAFSPTVQDAAVDVTTIDRVRAVQLEEDESSVITTQTAVTYTHTLTNSGNYTDVIALNWQSSQGWVGTLVTPASPVELAPFASTPLTFSLDIPAGSGGQTDVTVITATIQGLTTMDTVNDTTYVNPVYDFTLMPETRSATTSPDAIVVYTHTLHNTGNISDSFTLAAENSHAGWPLPVLSTESLDLPAGGVAEVAITVTVPSGAAGQTNVTTVTVTSLGGSFSKYAYDTTHVTPEGEDPILGLIAVNDSPTPLGDTTNLTATITSGSGVSYTWAFGDGAGDSGDVVTHIYPTVGNYTAIVTASNVVSTVTATTLVTITEVAITDLVAVNDSPTPLGDTTNLTATITSGSNVSYAWDFGDGTGDSGAVTTHVYPAVGTYTAIVTASNTTNVMTATTTVTITDVPVAGLVAVNDSPTILGDTTNLTATITAGSNVSYIWDFGDGTNGGGDVTTHVYPAVGIYTAIVTASNAMNVLTATTVVTITDVPIAGLVAVNDSPTQLGDTTTLTATITTGSGVSYAWAFGDGTGGSGDVTTHVYPAVGIYTAVVTASNTANVMTATTTVTITDVPVTGLVAVNDSPTPLDDTTTLTATTTSGSNVNYAWAFGDGETGSGDVVTHIYPAVGIYTAIVTASNTANVVTATTLVTITEVAITDLVAVNDSPTPLGDTTNLTATITAGSNVNYAWDFGDGTNGGGDVVTHTYVLTGTYTAVVTASNTMNVLTATTVVTITPPEPITGLVVTNDSPTPLGETTNLTATVETGSGVSYAWAFGDGESGSGDVVTHTYPAIGNYTAVVTASNMISVVTATTTVTITDVPVAGLVAMNDSPTPLGDTTNLTATITAGSGVSYTWDFGDGESGSGDVTTHVYPAIGTYTAVVTASNTTNVMTATTDVTITDVPVAGLVAVNDSPTIWGDTTNLTATITSGSNVNYAWDFGDGENGSGDVVTHTYPAVGTYTAVVTASNTTNVMTATTDVTITDVPVAGLVAMNDSPTILGDTTNLTATITEGSGVSYAWDFGDGTNGGGDATTHVYPAVGIYTAVVTASNTANVVTATTLVTITDAPIAGLVAVNDSPTPLGDTTTLTATITEGSGVSYAWAFGDGTNGGGDVVTHTYALTGTYTAVVTASNTMNVLTATTVVTITPPEPITGLVATNDSPTLLGETTNLTATVETGSGVSYTWAFGDGTNGGGDVVTHTYALTGTYTAVVTASNITNVMTATTTVHIISSPVFRVYLPLVLRNYNSDAPDLLVTALTAVRENEHYLISVSVENHGSQPVAYGNNFYVDLYVDREPVPLEVGDKSWGAQGAWFGVGESHIFTVTHTLAAGSHDLYAQVDTDNTVKESNESNNTYGPLPLTVTGVTGAAGPDNPTPTPGRGPRPTPTPLP